MHYYDDIRFLYATYMPRHNHTYHDRWPNLYTVQMFAGGEIFYAVDDHPRTLLKEPALYWHHPSHTYHYSSVTGTSWQHYFIHLDGPRAKRLLEEGFMPLSRHGFVYLRQISRTKNVFDQLIKTVNEKNSAEHFHMVYLLEELLQIAIEDSQSQNKHLPHYDRILEISNVMRTNPLGSYDLEAISKKIGLSYSHFRRLFKQYTNSSPHDLILNCRMQKAVDLLQNTHKPIKEISALLGYEDPAQFAKLFRNKEGLYPSEFRKRIQAVQEQN